MNEDQEHVTKRPSTFPLFSKSLKLQPLNVIEFSHSMRKHFQDFIEAFKKRIDIELTYSKSLEQVSKQLDKYIKPGTDKAISFISSAFRVQNQQRSHQAKQLADSLKTQIQDVCAEMHKNQTATVKKMQKQIKKYYKQANNLEQSHGKALEKYRGINKETEQMIITKNIMKYTTGIPQQKKIKLITKTMEGIKENKEYQKLYLSSVKEYNEFSTNYNKEITQQLDQIETQIRDQLIFESDCMRKLIVCEVSMFKNIEYDLISISKQMEYVDTQKDVQQFLDEIKGSLENSILPPPQQKEKDKQKDKEEAVISRISVGSTTSQDSNSTLSQLEEKKIIGKSLLSQSLLYVEEEYFSWMLSCKKSIKLRAMIENLWRKLNRGKELSNGQAENNAKIQEKQPKQSKQEKQSKPENAQNWEPQIKKQFVELMSCTKIMQNPNINTTSKSNIQVQNQELFISLLRITKSISQIWDEQSISTQKVSQILQVLNGYFVKHHYYRLLAYIFIEQYRIQHKVMFKKAENAKASGKLFRILLQESLKRDDVFIIRGLLGLMFTFYWTDEKSKRLLYQNKDIYDSDIWKRADLWEAAIFQTTYEEMAGFAAQKNETQAETILREKNLIFSQLASYCHYMIMLGITSKNVRLIVGRYCRLYQMSEEQNKDLSKMISNTCKQYKELVSQVTAKGQKFIQ